MSKSIKSSSIDLEEAETFGLSRRQLRKLKHESRPTSIIIDGKSNKPVFKLESDDNEIEGAKEFPAVINLNYVWDSVAGNWIKKKALQI